MSLNADARSKAAIATAVSSGHGGCALMGECSGSQGHNHNPYESQTQTTESKQWFEGETEELKDHLFDLVRECSADIFMKTQQQITSYMGYTYTQMGDIYHAIKNLALPT